MEYLLAFIIWFPIGFLLGVIFAPRSDAKERLHELKFELNPRKPVILGGDDPGERDARIAQMLDADYEGFEEEV